MGTIFLVKYETIGGHTHCEFFSAQRPGATWAKSGNFVLRNEDMPDLRKAMLHIYVMFEEVKSFPVTTTTANTNLAQPKSSDSYGDDADV